MCNDVHHYGIARGVTESGALGVILGVMLGVALVVVLTLQQGVM